MAGSKETPLTRQYNEIKSKYPDSILFFRLGDFYETFGQDAIITAKVCAITLTKRNNGAAGKTELAGFPHHQLDNYLPKLVKAGYRVAVCEQLEDPKKAKGIVKRGVTEIVTPGVALYDKMLDAGRNNFVMSVKLANAQKKKSPTSKVVGVSWLDISTGELFVEETTRTLLKDLVSAISPSEVVVSREELDELMPYFDSASSDETVFTKLESWIFDPVFCSDIIKGHFSARSTKGYGFDESSLVAISLGALLHYIKQLRGEIPSHITDIKIRNSGRVMNLDLATRRNLEITFSNFSGSKEGSLYGHIDKTKTAMGSRLIKGWLSAPLLVVEEIEKRLNLVESIYKDDKLDLRLEGLLNGLCDLERVIARISGGRYIPRDFRAVANCLDILPALVSELPGDIWDETKQWLLGFEALCKKLTDTITDDPPSSIGSGSSIKSGISSELDELKNAKYSAKEWLDSYKEKLRSDSGVGSLKIGQNNVFGYYIEISRIHSDKLDLAQLGLTRRQTLTNAERYISNELSEFEAKTLKAEERISQLEVEILDELASEISAATKKLQRLAHSIAVIDAIRSFAWVARQRGYTRPIINESGILDIKDGRHPVVERILPQGQSFISNDTHLDSKGDRLVVLTGPNMAGKSIYLRQNGLIVLLAQAGCYVPASRAEIGVVDRIFTRVGAQDNLAAGESTFLVEMQETASIMNAATNRSLLLLDEIGRGTATFDGISLAWSIAEHINQKLFARTIFATHYHELSELAELYDGILNKSVEVRETMDSILFTHKVIDGHTDHSFGIHVAKMAGLPHGIISRAKEIMIELESGQSSGDSDVGEIVKRPLKGISKTEESTTGQLSIFTFQDDELRAALKSMNIESMTPIDAFQRLAELISEAKGQYG